MIDLPNEFVIFDLEYTAWEGSLEKGWSGPNEHKEVVQIAALKVGAQKLEELDSFDVIVRPAINPKLSDFFIGLTGITQERVDKEGVNYEAAIKRFAAWVGELPLYSFGQDSLVLESNCKLANMDLPFAPERFLDVREYFKEHGIPAEEYYSSTIVRAFGVEPARRGHDAFNDVRTVLDGLRLLDGVPRA